MAIGARTATLSISGTGDLTMPTVILNGTGVDPVTVSPGTLAFGNQGLHSPTADKTVTVQNNTSIPVGLSFNLGGANPGDFQLDATTSPCVGLLAAKTSCTLNYLFNPTAVGARTATVSISGTGDAIAPMVILKGIGQ